MNDPSRPEMPGGPDLLIGQNNAVGEQRLRECIMFGSETQQAAISTRVQWVIPTDGGYFFVPSISSLRDVLGN